MGKKIINVCVFDEIDYKKPITFSRIKHILVDNDEIYSGYNEEYHGSDSAMDGHFYMRVNRDRIETDDEFNLRVIGNTKEMERSKNRRYNSYLKLKKEFENNEKLI